MEGDGIERESGGRCETGTLSGWRREGLVSSDLEWGKGCGARA